MPSSDLNVKSVVETTLPVMPSVDSAAVERNIFTQVSAVSRQRRASLLTSVCSGDIDVEGRDKFMGCTLWFTGLSGAGKTTLASALEDYLVSKGIFCYSLDGDNIRHGLCSDLGFSTSDRDENIRRVSQVAKLFADSGAICICSFVSPFASHRYLPRKLHKEDCLDFFEIFVDTPFDECERRDTKGLYKKARAGLIKGFTGIDQPYERPESADITINTLNRSVRSCLSDVIDMLVKRGVLQTNLSISEENVEPEKVGKALISKNIELFIDSDLKKSDSIMKAICVDLSTIDLQWVQVLSEGWAHPLRGFMREDEYLQTLHFNAILSKDDEKNQRLVSQSIAIVLPISETVKHSIDAMLREESENFIVHLKYEGGEVGYLTNVEVYPHRKEERIARQFGTLDEGHPTIKLIKESGDWLLGGDLHVHERIKWNDGLDRYRLTPNEIRERCFNEMKADTLFAFQLRNPIHNGHALLIKDTRRQLIENEGYSNPVLLLHPLGGWTKEDDVPLSVRIEQHEALLGEGVLDRKSTLLAIFPSPMIYAGPTEVQWHAKSREVAGVKYYIVGRDPAGLKHPSRPKEDLYDPTHGGRVLAMSPIANTFYKKITDNDQDKTKDKDIGGIKIIRFRVAAYNKVDKEMQFLDEKRKEDFLSISGTEMRRLARCNEQPPSGFMNEKAWNVLANFYNKS